MALREHGEHAALPVPLASMYKGAIWTSYACACTKVLVAVAVSSHVALHLTITSIKTSNMQTNISNIAYQYVVYVVN
jgi:hypothetical protein